MLINKKDELFSTKIVYQGQLETFLRYTILIFLSLFFFACSKTEQLKEQSTSTSIQINEDQKQKAFNFFIKGSLLSADGHTKKALKQYYNALALDPTSVRIYLAISEQQIILKRYKLAELNSLKSYELDSLHTDVLQMCLRVKALLKKYRESIDFSIKLLKIDPSNELAFRMSLASFDFLKDHTGLLNFVESYGEKVGYNAKDAYTIGVYYYDQKNTEKAQEWFEKSLKIDPDLAQARTALVQLKLQTKNSDVSAKDLKRLIEQNPENINIVLQLLERYRKEDRNKELREMITGLKSENDYLKLYLAEAFYKDQYYKEAKVIFDEINFSEYNIYFELIAGDCERQLNNLESGLIHFKNVIKRIPSFAQGYRMAGTILIEQERYIEAEKLIKIGVVKANHGEELRPILAEALLKLNKINEANEHLNNLLATHGKNKEILSEIARSYQNGELFAKSDSIYEIIVKMDSTDALILNNYSYSLADRNVNLDRAAILIKKALVLEPNNSFYLDTMGWVYFRLKKFNLARKFIQKSIEIRGEENTSFEVFDHMGDVFNSLNKKKRAIEYWKKAIHLEPDNIELKKKLGLNK